MDDAIVLEQQKAKVMEDKVVLEQKTEVIVDTIVIEQKKTQVMEDSIVLEQQKTEVTEDTTVSKQQKTEIMEDAVVLYPSPGIGHVVSMVELGKLILRHHNHQISNIIIILTTGLMETPSLTSYIQNISKSIPSISFISLPLIPPTALTLNGLARIFEFIRSNSPNLRNTLQEISKTHKIRAFIIDLFCTFSLPVATELHIPTYFFCTSGAAILGFFLYFRTVNNKQLSPTESFRDLPDKFLDIPGLPPIRATHVPDPILSRFDQAYDDCLYISEHIPMSNGIIVNTYDDLEPNAIKVIADGECCPGDPVPPIYNIGPLIADPNDQQKEKGKNGEEERNGCLSWLDAQPSQSVVFLCFGSMGTFSLRQLEEIAIGLEKSEQRFLWVVKNPPPDEKSKQTHSAMAGDDVDLSVLLPEGFLERTKDRGLAVKSWAPQVDVLSHDSVGAFVTHCGWNSVLEAVIAGVPIVTWPLYAEQRVNRAVLVESIKIALPLEERSEDGLVPGAELEKRLRELMDSEQGKELRERSRKMKEMAVAAWGELGSSTIALKKLMDDWQAKD